MKRRTVTIKPDDVRRVGDSVVFTERRDTDLEIRVVVQMPSESVWLATAAAKEFRSQIAVVKERFAAAWRACESALKSLTGEAQ